MSDDLSPQQMVAYINSDDNPAIEVVLAAQVLATMEVAKAQREFTAVQSRLIAVQAEMIRKLEPPSGAPIESEAKNE